jgi:hypothetical protein
MLPIDEPSAARALPHEEDSLELRRVREELFELRALLRLDSVPASDRLTRARNEIDRLIGGVLAGSLAEDEKKHRQRPGISIATA